MALRDDSSQGGRTSVSPEVIGGLVHGEAGAVGRQLEQHAAGFLEVHRLEPEAIDDGRRPAAGGGDLRSHGELVSLVVDAPCQVVHGADAPCARG